MQFLTSLTADHRLLTLGAAVAAFLVFAVLILLLVRLVFGNRLRIGGGRGRQQRLGVVDAFDMDRQRQLVLVRRDNTEHLIMIGGPNDLLIESTILRVEPRDRPASTAREASEPPRIPAPEMWSAPAIESGDMPTPAASLPPAVLPTPAVPSPVVTAGAMPASAEPVAETPPVVEPPPRSRDFITRMRGRGTPSDAAPEPAPVPPQETSPPAPEPPPIAREPVAPQPAAPQSAPPPPRVPPAPPLADADFFETEIARALAPSMRGRPLAPLPPVPEAASTAGSAGSSDANAPPPLPPRAPFRPFPARRDPPPLGGTASEGNEAGAQRRPPSPRPPPPPFFSRMSKDRTEPPIGDGRSTTSEPTPPPPVVHAEEPPPPVPQPTPESKPAHEPPAAPKVDAADPFEEEMARLLGRTPDK